MFKYFHSPITELSVFGLFFIGVHWLNNHIEAKASCPNHSFIYFSFIQTLNPLLLIILN